MFSRSVSRLLLLAAVCCPTRSFSDDALFVGFGKTDVTPAEPLRLSGYSSRSDPFVGVDESLFARAMAMRAGEEGPLAVLLSVDTIGFPGTLTKSILQAGSERFGLTRERFVICCTHSHTAPEVGALQDMFNVPFTQEQKEKTQAYTERLAAEVLSAVKQSIDDLQPGRIFAGQGEATFAVNRRVIENGTWAGFGVNPRGPVDHALPFLKVTGPDGEAIRGIVFNYACHCTTFGGEYNRVNGDWAGYAAKYLEEKHPGATALCTIGCGADSNPQRDREKAFEFAQAQGQEIADEINGLLNGDLTEVTARPTASFGYAGLPIDRPTREDLEEGLKSSRRPVRVHAEKMLDTWERMGRLPETYPMPIQVWRFGDQFSMVFLGGEVCVDYGLRIKKELGPGEGAAGNSQRSTLNPQLTPWVVAYANDVFGYVASERMRPEGGYEVDFSMIYYMLPGRWSTGTEEVVLRRVHEMYDNTGKVGPLAPGDAMGTFTYPEGYRLEVVCAEPLIRDPINMALADDGSLWVVEMGDYPRGKPGATAPSNYPTTPWDGPPGGTIKKLSDTDGDGRYDESETFLDGLSFPTGVYPWKGGVLVSAAPDIFFAVDTDGDGRADERRPLYRGFEEANPQHRINGFVEGLDGWLYLASGTNNGTITSVKTGQTLDMSGRDLRIRPETGEMEALSGRSQFGRTRDADGNWFGNDNSDPLWHYVIEDRYLRRNPFVAAPSPKVYLTEPARAPPVYPTSRTLDRFNDLFALNRFTSACSPHIWRAQSTSGELTALVCEPVHNLVSRVVLEPDGVTFHGRRHEDEQHSEFFSSTDNWFRPVKVIEEPDGALLVCDMYRHVIEHPQWIPEAWQAQLDLYAGNRMGRIYRLSPPSASTTPARNSTSPEALSEQGSLRNLTSELRAGSMRLTGLLKLVDHDDVRVRYQVALMLGELEDRRVAEALLSIAKRDPADQWIRTAVLSSAVPHARAMLEELLRDPAAIAGNSRLLEGLISTALGEQVEDSAPGIAALIAGSVRNSEVETWQTSALASFLEAVQRRGSSWERIMRVGDADTVGLAAIVRPIFDHARRVAQNKSAVLSERTGALSLLGHQSADREEDLRFLKSLLSPRVAAELQSAAVDALSRRRGDDLPAVLLGGWSQHTPSLRSEILSALLARDSWTESLVEALETGDVSANDLDAASRQRLLSSRRRQVRDAAAKLFGAATENDRAEVLSAYAEVLALNGNVQNGAAIFKKACSSCHQHGGVGKDLAPRLATVRNKSVDAFLTAILDPNQAVEQKYQGYVVVTGDGRVRSGLVKTETGGSLTLAEPTGQEHEILRIDIEEMQATGKSFMPEGLEKDLSPQAVADVIAFIRQTE